MLHFSKSDEETNSSTSWMSEFSANFNFRLTIPLPVYVDYYYDNTENSCAASHFCGYCDTCVSPLSCVCHVFPPLVSIFGLFPVLVRCDY